MSGYPCKLLDYAGQSSDCAPILVPVEPISRWKGSVSRPLGGRVMRLALSCLLLAVALGLTAPVAWARVDPDDVYIEIDQVDIDATVDTSGKLSVREVRTFEGSFNGVYWYLPRGEYNDIDVETEVVEVGEVVGGVAHPFTMSNGGEDGSYSLELYSDAVRVKVYSEHYDETAQIYVAYESTNVARRYDDVAELYWQFVTRGWDVESENVTCTVHLPVPEGKVVEPEENVRAWGHGPLDATVFFDGNDVVYEVPGVGTSEYAEARITFTAEWLSGTSSVGGRVLQDILAEERAWADEANATRQRARFLTYGGAGALGLGVLFCLIWPFVALARYRRTHKPHFDDKYFRDVPSNDHPAVLGALYHDGTVEDELFTATLMHLTDQKAITLEEVKKVKKRVLLGDKEERDYRLVCPPTTADLKLNKIDRKAVHVLFLDFARRAPKHDDVEKGEEVLYFSDLEYVAKHHPSAFESSYSGWKAQVEAEVASRRFFVSDLPSVQWQPISCVVGTVLLGLATFGYIAVTDAYGLGALLILAELIALAVGLYVIGSTQDISSEALELKAQLEALRRWLLDFTRLEEAVPRDVVLWNRLLVMAVALGVADEVIEQLRTHIPEVLEDPYMRPMYGWYHMGPHTNAYRAFNSSYATAHSVSTAKLAKSSSSSGSGGGGGFSGGGGGGFGGGGGGHSGGGAF